MDYDLLLKLARISKIIYIPELISFFRMHVSAKSSTLMKKHWHESLRVKMKYNKLYSWKGVLLYLRFRVFDILPAAAQNIVRRNRNSINDKLILGTKQEKM
jgi:hypothetical protein